MMSAIALSLFALVGVLAPIPAAVVLLPGYAVVASMPTESTPAPSDMPSESDPTPAAEMPFSG